MHIGPILLAYGLGLTGLLVLILSAVYSRTLLAAILRGILGAGLMLANFALLRLASGIVTATTSSGGDPDIPRIASFVCCFAVAFYFVLVPMKFKRD